MALHHPVESDQAEVVRSYMRHLNEVSDGNQKQIFSTDAFSILIIYICIYPRLSNASGYIKLCL